MKNFAYHFAVTAFCSVPFILLPLLSFAQGGEFKNPLRFQTVEAFVEGALQAFVYIAIPAIGFFIVLSGLQFIIAQGDPAKLGKAKQNFFHVIIGASLILGAWALAVLIKGTIDQLRG